MSFNFYGCRLYFNIFTLFLDQTPTVTNSNNNTGGQLVPPPLTPGTNKKMTEALQATFASWEKERHKLNVPKGNNSATFCTYIYTESRT